MKCQSPPTQLFRSKPTTLNPSSDKFLTATSPSAPPLISLLCPHKQVPGPTYLGQLQQQLASSLQLCKRLNWRWCHRLFFPEVWIGDVGLIRVVFVVEHHARVTTMFTVSKTDCWKFNDSACQQRKLRETSERKFSLAKSRILEKDS